jgi:DNA topoisomerase-1
MGRSGERSDAKAATRAARLRYVNLEEPGIARIRRGKGFSYRAYSGRAVGRAARQRIERLAIPPAWTDVWICKDENGHIQAVGRDARGRKQYRYHDAFRRTRDKDKYEHLLAFARVLPRIRSRVEKDLRGSRLTKERVLAAVVRLLDLTHLRIGNEEYARENESFGLTTARNRHASVGSGRVRLAFRGKGGSLNRVEVSDSRLARLVARCQDLPGQRLFEWCDDGDNVRPLKSDDVNEYLRTISGADVTAKDFRTWAATLCAVCTLERLGPRTTQSQRKKAVLEAVREAAGTLGNTPAVCRRSYIHPEPLDAYLAGTLCESMVGYRRHAPRRRWLSADERMLRALLERQHGSLTEGG